MVIYLIDDEDDALELLEMAVKDAVSDAEVICFNDPVKAVDEARIKKPDVVFTDIQMPEMTGLQLCMNLKKFNPRLNVIFVTAYSEYSMEAVSLHASGYVMKPINARKVKEELDNLLYSIDETQDGFYARTFGIFNFMKNGKAITFKREKSRELLALLVDKECAISNEQIAAYLFEDRPYDAKAQNQITTIISELRRSLREVGGEHLLIKTWGYIQLDKNAFRCDAYDYWEGKPYAINLFHGEYMEDFSWAEDSKARFYWDSIKPVRQ